MSNEVKTFMLTMIQYNREYACSAELWRRTNKQNKQLETDWKKHTKHAM